MSRYNLDSLPESTENTLEQSSVGTEVQGIQDENGSEEVPLRLPTPPSLGNSTHGLRYDERYGDRIHYEGRRDEARVTDQIGRSIFPSRLQSPRPDGSNLPSASIQSAVQFLGLPGGTQTLQPPRRRHSSKRTSSYGEQIPLSFQLSGNRIVGGSSQPEVVVPRAPRGTGSTQNPRVREGIQIQPEPLAGGSLNEGSGATVLSTQGDQEGYALYGDVHASITEEYPIPRNLGLYYAGFDAGIGGLPVTIRMATNIQHFVLDVTLPDRTNITIRPFNGQQN